MHKTAQCCFAAFQSIIFQLSALCLLLLTLEVTNPQPFITSFTFVIITNFIIVIIIIVVMITSFAIVIIVTSFIIVIIISSIIAIIIVIIISFTIILIIIVIIIVIITSFTIILVIIVIIIIASSPATSSSSSSSSSSPALSSSSSSSSSSPASSPHSHLYIAFSYYFCVATDITNHNSFSSVLQTEVCFQTFNSEATFAFVEFFVFCQILIHFCQSAKADQADLPFIGKLRPEAAPENPKS